MRFACILLVGVSVGIPSQASEGENPIHPADAATLRAITEREHLDAPPDYKPQGWPLQKGDKGVRFSKNENPRCALTVVLDGNGRITKYLGNGPILSNESFVDLSRLPELRVIRIDHNIPGPGSNTPHERYDGSGFAALEKSKLEEVKIGHAFNDKGMVALAKVLSVRSMHIGHSKVTDDGLRSLANHPNLTIFRVSSQGRPERVTEKCLAVFATLPKLRELGLHETFVSYDGGLKQLKTVQTLETLSLKGSLVLPADVEKLKTDLSNLTVETSTPAELLASPNSRGVARWASPEAKEYLKTGEKK